MCYRLLQFDAVLLVLVAAGVARAEESAELRGRLEREAGKAWGEYLAFARQVRGTVSSTDTDLKSGKVTEGERVSFITDGGAGMYEHELDGQRQIEFGNPRYSCRLVELGPDKFKMVEFNWQKAREKALRSGFVEARDDGDTLRSEPDRLAVAYACRGLMISATWLPAMFVSPSFKIAKVEAADDVAAGAVRVDFEYAPENTRSNSLRNGWVVLDPTKYWQIVQAEVALEEPRSKVTGTKTIANEFAETAEGFPYAARSRLGLVAANAEVSVENETVYTTKLEMYEPGDGKAFELEAYGLKVPERM